MPPRPPHTYVERNICVIVVKLVRVSVSVVSEVAYVVPIIVCVIVLGTTDVRVKIVSIVRVVVVPDAVCIVV